MQSLHFWSGIVWVIVLALIVLGGDRRGVARTAREIDGFDGDDWRWLTGRKPAPQGRFNAGQKLNTVLTAAFLVLFLRLRACCSGSASATRSFASRARSCSTTG